MSRLRRDFAKVFNLKIAAAALNTKNKVLITKAAAVHTSGNIGATCCFVKVENGTCIVTALNYVQRHIGIRGILSAKRVLSKVNNTCAANRSYQTSNIAS